MTWKSSKRVLCGLASLASLLCFHDSFATVRPQTQMQGGWFLGADAGVVWPSISGSASVTNGSSAPPPSGNDVYHINTPPASSLFSLFGGYRHLRQKWFLPAYSLALRFQHLNTFPVRGTIEQYSLPAFTNYNYRFNLSSNIYALQGKVDVLQFGPFAPYLSGGIGMASHVLSDYTESAVAGVTPRTSPSYSDSTTNTFMYDLGAGIDMNLNNHCLAYIGYEYANLGKPKSGHGSAAWSSQAVSLGTLRTSNLLVGLSWLIS